MGLDGRYYELTIKDLMAEATYRWWEKPDPGWEPLVAIAGSLLNLGSRVSVGTCRSEDAATDDSWYTTADP
jgi:hypothetical protein